jgi:hypothetical protein
MHIGTPAVGRQVPNYGAHVADYFDAMLIWPQKAVSNIQPVG